MATLFQHGSFGWCIRLLDVLAAVAERYNACYEGNIRPSELDTGTFHTRLWLVIGWFSNRAAT